MKTDGAHTAFAECFRLKRRERVLVVFDEKKRDIAEMFGFSAQKISSDVKLLRIPEPRVNGEEPLPFVGKAMLEHDIVLLVTSKSLSHTSARKNACLRGTRIASLPGITSAMMKLLALDYGTLRTFSRKLMKILKKGKKIRMVTSLGSDFSCLIDHTTLISDDGQLWKRGAFCNLPCGEVFFAPQYGSASGRYVVDLSHAGVGLLKRKIVVDVTRGFGRISGGKEAKKLERMLLGMKNKNAFNIAEVGIGTNPLAKVHGLILEDEKVLGTCHIALGNNFSFGGKVKVGVHVDGVIAQPSIFVDGKMVMEKGKFVL